jgi:type IV pilus assembly protein PilY1
LTDHTVEWGVSEYGWYIDLPDTGERVVVDPLLYGGIVFFNSMVPSSNLCQGGGSGFLYTVDMENGGAPDFAAFDFNNDGVVDVHDVATDGSGNTENPSRVSFGGEVPTGSVIVGNQQYTASSDGPIDAREVFEIKGLTGRLSWQELTTF